MTKESRLLNASVDAVVGGYLYLNLPEFTEFILKLGACKGGTFVGDIVLGDNTVHRAHEFEEVLRVLGFGCV